MALAVSAVRQRVEQRIAAMLTDWRASASAWDVFGLNDAEARFHRGFAVGTPDTTYVSGRQRTNEGALCRTSLRVRWAWNLAAKDQVASYDDALDAERKITAVLAGMKLTPDLQLTFVSASRRVEDEWVIGDQEWTALHTLPLT